MRRPLFIPALACPLLVLVLSAAAGAQQLVPVDQAVGDLDALSRSQRRVETGLRTTGEQSNLFQLTPGPMLAPGQLSPATWDPLQPQVFYRVGPGFVARVDRLDYIVRTGPKTLGLNIAPLKDGEFRDAVPANTVFELRPVFTEASMGLGPGAAPPATQPSPPDPRIDRRADRALDGRPNGYRIEPVRIDNQIRPVMIDNQVTPKSR